MVMPRSRSALSLSRTQAYLKEPFPSSAASYRCCKQTFFGDRKNSATAPLCPAAAQKLGKMILTEPPYLLKLFNRSLVDTTALVDQVACDMLEAGTKDRVG